MMLFLTPIESINFIATDEDEVTTFRRKIESMWIERLATARPSGLNVHTNSGIVPFVIP